MTDKKSNGSNSLPEYCYVFLPTTYEIGIIQRGESGYYRTDTQIRTSEEAVERLTGIPVSQMGASERLGVTKAQAEAMKAGSMFGWDVPAADPNNYDENGHLIKPKRENKGYER